MTHTASHIIINSIIHLWDEDEYPGVREHFSSEQLDRIDAFEGQTVFTVADKWFLSRMVGKLLFASD